MLCLMLMGRLPGHPREEVRMDKWSAPFYEQELKEEAPAGPLGGDNPENAPGTGAGVRGCRVMTGGGSRIPVALRQPSRCLLTQKGCRLGANLPHGGGAWTGTETGEQGPEGV